KKLKDYPATKDYSGPPNDVEACTNFIESKFRKLFEQSVNYFSNLTNDEWKTSVAKRQLLTYSISALDLDTVRFVFIDLHDMLTGRKKQVVFIFVAFFGKLWMQQTYLF
ncbi:hypothetical protein RFI_22055, partial [Reticulomyxa filosa]